jgi:hypothetical protein
LNVGTSLVTLKSVVINFEALFHLGYDSNNVITSSDANVTLKHTSITLNRTTTSVYNSLGSVNNPGTHVYNSVVYNPLVPVRGVESGQATNCYACVLSDAPQAKEVITNSEFNGLFVNRNGFDHRLQPGAMTINYCDGSGSALPATTDFNGIDRESHNLNAEKLDKLMAQLQKLKQQREDS